MEDKHKRHSTSRDDAPAAHRSAINVERAMYFRDRFRGARAAGLRNAEDFQAAIVVIERFGMFLSGRQNQLGGYESEILGLANLSTLAEDIPKSFPEFHVPFAKLYNIVRDGRNSAVHEGALARHITDKTRELCIVLEDALQTMSDQISFFMVRGVVSASLWHPISFIRQSMLENSFSFLPVESQAEDGTSLWRMLSDLEVARYLREASTKGSRNTRIAQTLEDAIKVDDGIELAEARFCQFDAVAKDVLGDLKAGPLLVRGKDEVTVLGIVTAFDLL